jgi:cytochrome P450
MKYARDMIGEITFGSSPEALDVIEAQKMIARSRKLAFLRFVMPRLVVRFPSFFGVKKIFDGMAQLDKLMLHPQEGTLLFNLLKASSGSCALILSEVKSNTLSFGTFGIDAIASALTSLMFVMVTHHQAQEKIRQEMEQVFDFEKKKLS